MAPSSGIVSARKTYNDQQLFERGISVKPSYPDSSSRLKALVAATPVLGAAARSLARNPVVKGLRGLRRRLEFPGSSSYWEQRYRQGGTSGSGSFGRLAEFKAETLNGFVARMGIQSVIEFGCGDGAQLALAGYPRYVGIDVAEPSISACRQRFVADATKSFYLASQLPADLGRFDLVLSLDVIYHLVEDEVFGAYMRSLFANAGRFVVIYSSNKVEPSDAPHVRHRLFTHWIEVHEPQWRKTGYLPNKYPSDPARPDETSFADFYFFERR
jgi:SAM-dependent methyltransferase